MNCLGSRTPHEVNNAPQLIAADAMERSGLISSHHTRKHRGLSEETKT